VRYNCFGRNEIKSEHVKTFREGLAKYLEAIENLKRLNEKREDAAKYLQSLYDRRLHCLVRALQKRRFVEKP